MPQKKTAKVTFYVDADVKKSLDKIDPGVKSHTINDLLRQGFKRGATVEARLEALETLLKKMEADVQFDGFAIAAIRRVMLNRSGGMAAQDLQKEFDDIFYGSGGTPPRHRW
jgi:hypothetical protein